MQRFDPINKNASDVRLFVEELEASLENPGEQRGGIPSERTERVHLLVHLRTRLGHHELPDRPAVAERSLLARCSGPRYHSCTPAIHRLLSLVCKVHRACEHAQLRVHKIGTVIAGRSTALGSASGGWRIVWIVNCICWREIQLFTKEECILPRISSWCEHVQSTVQSLCSQSWNQYIGFKWTDN